MIQRLAQRVLPAIARIGADPDDEDDIRLQKSLLVVCSFPFMFAGFAWGIMYFSSTNHWRGRSRFPTVSFRF